jgi:hypothetical protein
VELHYECADAYQAAVAPRCGQCDQPVRGVYLVVGNQAPPRAPPPAPRMRHAQRPSGAGVFSIPIPAAHKERRQCLHERCLRAYEEGLAKQRSWISDSYKRHHNQ